MAIRAKYFTAVALATLTRDRIRGSRATPRRYTRLLTVELSEIAL